MRGERAGRDWQRPVYCTKCDKVLLGLRKSSIPSDLLRPRPLGLRTIGATGALITVKAIHELQRIQGRYALVTMCIGGGQGIAAIFERL